MSSQTYRKRRRPLEVKTKVWFEAGGRFVLGEGGIALLEGIREQGSIQGAARRLGWSYRHTWGYIRNMEESAGVRFIDRTRGGRAGGGARLTPEAREFLRRYGTFRRALARLVDGRFRKVFSG